MSDIVDCIFGIFHGRSHVQECSTILIVSSNINFARFIFLLDDRRHVVGFTPYPEGADPARKATRADVVVDVVVELLVVDKASVDSKDFVDTHTMRHMNIDRITSIC